MVKIKQQLYKNKEWLFNQYIILNKTTREIGKEINYDHGTIWRWLNKFNIPMKESFKIGHTINVGRKATIETKLKMSNNKKGHKGYMLGKKHTKEAKERIGKAQFKGDDVKYSAIHQWLRKKYPPPNNCQECGIIGKKLDLSNITGIHKRSISNYKYLCKSCHMKQDNIILNIKKMRCIV
ncbi:hypothetical protein LCGC14_2900940 [marine sediment metagenome]|uniref:Nuclease associated modular domain-containing protein n=1 Tax=marine sediment metagenome TaxID=412755 RepID=A0A0F9AKK3_9ZZZZ